MSELPTGTVTFLFTDIEGSIRLLRELGDDRYGRAQDAHAEVRSCSQPRPERSGGP